MHSFIHSFIKITNKALLSIGLYKIKSLRVIVKFIGKTVSLYTIPF